MIVIILDLVLRFVFVRQFRPALYMARAEEAGTPVTIGTRLKLTDFQEIAGKGIGMVANKKLYPSIPPFPAIE